MSLDLFIDYLHLTAREENPTIIEFVDSVIEEKPLIEQVGVELSAAVARSLLSSVILNFSNVTSVQYPFIEKLVYMQKLVKAKKGKLVLCGLKPEIMEMFCETDHLKEFSFAHDVEEARKKFPPKT